MMTMHDYLKADIVLRDEPALELEWDEDELQACEPEEVTAEHSYSELELRLSAIAEERRRA